MDDLILQTGLIYLTKNNRIVTIMNSYHNALGDEEVYVGDNNRHYSSNGQIPIGTMSTTDAAPFDPIVALYNPTSTKEDPATELKIKVGKSYLNTKNKVVTIVNRNTSSSTVDGYEYISDITEYYKVDGTPLFDDDLNTQPSLVKEFTEKSSQSPLSIEVRKSYLCESGKVVTITHVTVEYMGSLECLLYAGDDNYLYTQGGYSITGYQSEKGYVNPENLISEYIEEETDE